MSVLAVLLLSGCSDLPQRGFATRFFNNNVDLTLNPSTAFDGSPLVTPSGTRLAPDACEVTARARAQDVAAQGFGPETQQQVFQGALMDCRKWRERFYGPSN
ncbi:MAG: hypothetical protein ISS15_00625 [Alphaproteobacteria bacterium]|nr:hypothetical protein [Alphaproteobacteria bacterium]MBL6937304.1 hypothetical protein [Alphaproteobacteria bacterium]MBL7096134.1 hypothetical protein [Alphaproteobacteria bacterium]